MTEQLEFDEYYKTRLLKVIRKSLNSETLSEGDVCILYHWVRHQNEPEYDFVPEEYRTESRVR